MQERLRRGTSLIDLLISMGIIAILFGGIYLVYFSIVTAIANISAREAAVAAVQAQIETIHNLPYASIGTVGGVPSGVIQPTQTVPVGSFSFVIQTTIRNIDDPFDGTLNGTPADTAPADYKLVSIVATCPLCANFVSVSITTTVAPKNLESATQNGSLFVYALDANGGPVAGANIHVVNSLVVPSIDLNDTTNASGVLQLVGVPTSTQGYQITATKSGYSSERTYPIGAPSNPNPSKPNATVAAQTVTGVTFSIDRTSGLTVYSSDNRCVPVGNESFSLQGAKLIGTDPDVLKFATTSATAASGSVSISNLEWDSYALTLNDAAKNIVGTIPQDPTIINPSSSAAFRFVLAPASNPSLLATVVSAATGAVIPGAAVTASKSGFSQTLTAGHAFVTDTTWAAGLYGAQSGGLDASSAPGRVTLSRNASGTYATSTNDWLISNTIDLGGSSSTLYGISWNLVSQPNQTSLKFQIAANNDNATWNFVGPDGSAGSFFATSSSSLPAALSGNRYLSYKAYFNTQSKTVTPELDDVTIEFSANCVPPAQAFFAAMPQGSYTVSASANGYSQGSTTASIGSGAATAVVSLVPLP